MKDCPHCKSSIHDKATKCPHCGGDIGSMTSVWGLGIALISIGALLTMLVITASIGIPLLIIGVVILALAILTTFFGGISSVANAKNVKKPILIGLIVGLTVLGFISSRPKPTPVKETAPLLAEGEQSKLELAKKLAEVQITQLDNGKRVFTDTGWQVYLTQFNPEYEEVTASCRIEMDECEGWKTIASELGVDQYSVKYTYYYAKNVALTDPDQAIYDQFQALVQSSKPQTAEEETQLISSFAKSHALPAYELKAILAKGDFYKPD